MTERRRRGTAAADGSRSEEARRRSRIVLHGFLILAALLWISPIVWAIFTALRPYADTSQSRLSSRGRSSSTSTTSRTAWNQADMPHYFWNSIIVALPAIVLILLFSSAIAFVDLAATASGSTCRC